MNTTLSTGIKIKKKKKLRKKDFELHLMMLIPMAMIVLFAYVPLYGLRLAFVDYYNPALGIVGSPWGGFKWFEYLFNLPEFGRIIRNTVMIAGLKIIFNFPIPIVVAILLDEVRNMTFKKTVQTIIYLPSFLSWVIVAGMIFELFRVDGMVNGLLSIFNVEPIRWMTNGPFFVAMLVISEVWKGFGMNTIIYLATLAGISPELHEAAEMDGANRWQRILHVTIPGIMPIAMLLAIMSLNNILNAGFEQILLLYNTSVADVAEILDTYVYYRGIVGSNVELASAAGLLKSVVAAIFIVITNILAYKFTDYRVI